MMEWKKKITVLLTHQAKATLTHTHRKQMAITYSNNSAWILFIPINPFNTIHLIESSILLAIFFSVTGFKRLHSVPTICHNKEKSNWQTLFHSTPPSAIWPFSPMSGLIIILQQKSGYTEMSSRYINNEEMHSNMLTNMHCGRMGFNFMNRIVMLLKSCQKLYLLCHSSPQSPSAVTGSSENREII